MNKLFFKIVSFLLLSVISLNTYGQDIPEPMSPPRLVNDFANIFSSAQTDDLEQILRNYTDTTSTQIFVVTVSDLGGYDISDYAIRLGEKWEVGQKDKDNGAVILIKPRIGIQRGGVFIATGYGLEPILTDARVGRIIDDYMIPHFQNEDYYNGTKDAVHAMINYLSGEFKADKTESPFSVFNILIGLFILYIIVRAIKGNKKSKRRPTYTKVPRTVNRPVTRSSTPRTSTYRSTGTSTRSSSSSRSSGSSFKGGGGGRVGGGGAGRSF